MADVRKFDERLSEVVARQLGRELPSDDGWMNLPKAERDAYWAAVEAQGEREWREEKTRTLLKSLPAMYRDAQPRHDLSQRWLTAYRERRCVNLAIFGPAGVGKTWEAAGIARELLVTDRVPVLMIRVPEMLDKLRPNVDGASDLGQFQAAPVLVMDDLGSEKPSEWVDQQLYLLADYRERTLLPTIFTSNLGDEALEERYNDRLLRRWFDNSGKLVIRERPPNVRQETFKVEL